MAQFTFDLDGVLRQRKNVEQLAQRQAAVAQQALQDLKDQLRRLDDDVQKVTADVRQNHLTGTINVSFITAHRRYILNMERAALELAQKIGEAQLKVDAATAALLEAAKARKGIEKLRERNFERWSAAQAKKENENLDEAGMQIAFNNLSDDASSND